MFLVVVRYKFLRFSLPFSIGFFKLYPYQVNARFILSITTVRVFQVLLTKGGINLGHVKFM